MPAPTEPAQPGIGTTELGRLLSRVENVPAALGDALAEVGPPRSSHRIGFTGSPGVGKSTLLAALVPAWVEAGSRVGVLAVDPTSAVSGGAVLGDRLRWSALERSGVFIRSLASRGSLGGLAPGAGAAAALLEAAGYDPLVIETVGVGQTGSEVLALADTVVVLLSPEGGDGLQMLKAGLLEVGDIFVVNKADRPGAELTLQELRQALQQSASTDADAWQAPVLSAVASAGQGISPVSEAIQRHRDWLAALPADHPRRRIRRQREIEYLLRARLAALTDAALKLHGADLAAQVELGAVTTAAAAEQLLKLIGLP